MEPIKALWGSVREGSIIRDKTGHTWKVVKMNATHVGLRDRDEVEKIISRPHPRAAVTQMILTPDELDQILTEQLGAEPIYWETGNKGGLEALPFDQMDRGTQAYHLKFMHHRYIGDSKDEKKLDLTAIHDELHATNDGRGIPHVHLGLPEVEKHRRA